MPQIVDGEEERNTIFLIPSPSRVFKLRCLQLKHIATWIRECDEAHFERVFSLYPEVCLQNARRETLQFEKMQALLLSGGSDISAPFLKQPVPDPKLIEDPDPARDAWDFEAIGHALGRQLPILAICRGLQVLNVHLGGTLHLHVPGHDNSKYENNQRLRYSPGSEFVFSSVNSSHHQALDQTGKGLVIEAWSVADNIIEQAHLENYPFAVAVQYHPERDPLYQSLFQAFVENIKEEEPS